MDSLKYAKILEGVGLTRQQAETHIRILSEALVGGDMATTNDLTALNAKIGKRFDQVDKRFQQVDKRFQQVEHRLDQLDIKIDRVEERLNLRLDNLQTQIIVKLGALMTVLFGSALGAASLIFA